MVVGMVASPSAVAGPAFSVQTPYDDHHLRERHPEVRSTFPTRSVHHTSFLWALCYEPVRSTTHRFVDQNRAGFLPFPEISPAQVPPDARGSGASRSRPAVEVDVRPLGQRPQRLGRRLQGGDQERGESWRLAGALTAAPTSQTPEASTAIERFMLRLPLSSGLLPAFSPPLQGALG